MSAPRLRPRRTPPIAAALVTADGSFRHSLTLFGGICAVGAIGAVWLRKPAPPEEGELQAVAGEGSGGPTDCAA